MRPLIETLSRLGSSAFPINSMIVKTEKGLVDFADLEHYLP